MLRFGYIQYRTAIAKSVRAFCLFLRSMACVHFVICALLRFGTYTTQYWAFKVLVGEENVVVITDIITFEIL